MSIDATLKNIRLLICDVDGIFTDGKLHFLPDGQEVKVFSVYDGFGIRRLQKANVDIAIISGRGGAAAEKRFANLDIKHVFLNIHDKILVYKDLLEKLQLDDSQVAYIGDDINDLDILERVALPVSVPNARPEAKAAATYITKATGGDGAVRELCEMIIAAQA